ncbi:hypothetical protein ABIB62_002377 [Mucilaginibacter sp. UYP25]|uniref:hypothetical protein n=1 Tax=unclassified Mucilaginibacter TaxID=2617802 RepID=UPI0033985490
MKIVSPLFISVAKVGLTLTPFLIGGGLSRIVLTAVGFSLCFKVWCWIATSTAVVCGDAFGVMQL